MISLACKATALRCRTSVEDVQCIAERLRSHFELSDTDIVEALAYLDVIPKTMLP